MRSFDHGSYAYAAYNAAIYFVPLLRLVFVISCFYAVCPQKSDRTIETTSNPSSASSHVLTSPVGAGSCGRKAPPAILVEALAFGLRFIFHRFCGRWCRTSCCANGRFRLDIGFPISIAEKGCEDVQPEASPPKHLHRISVRKAAVL